MRGFIAAVLLLALVLTSCAKKHRGAEGATFGPGPGATTAAGAKPGEKLIVTPEPGLTGKVAKVNPDGRFVVLNFPLGHLPPADQHLSIYRQGLKVGEVKITGPQLEDNIVADLIAGEARVGDEARQ